jgi:hypothetical protein
MRFVQSAISVGNRFSGNKESCAEVATRRRSNSIAFQKT